MENHPIPQDVSHFQFKLIGDMTIKQFAYLGAGILLGWFFFSLPLFFLFKFIFVFFFVGTGLILAFLPIDGRPADNMLIYFIKALFSANQYIYQQAGVQNIAAPNTAYVDNTSSKKDAKNEEAQKQQQTVHLQALPAAFSQPTQTTSATPSVVVQPVKVAPSPIKTPAVSQEVTPAPTQALAQEAAILSQELQTAKQEETKQTQGTKEAEEAHQKTKELETELQEILQQKQQLEKQLLSLQQQLAKKREQVFTPSMAPETPQQTQHVRKIPKTLGVAAGLPFIPDVPNLVMGIVKDPRGNALPNILVEIKDKDDNPVRAFKTNALGQFVSATPLVSGTYSISFEDPKGKQSFDSVELQATGEVLMPLEVISVDAREELRKELFGPGQVNPA